MFPRRVVDAVVGEALLPSLRAARCVRWRGDQVCRACELACPHQALWLDPRGSWHLDASACDGCGACASACPSQAIDAPGVDADAMRRAWRGADRVTLCCARSDGHADVRVPCLAGIHPEVLATLLLRHPGTPVVLDLSSCQGCASGALRPVIEAQARQARDYARLAGALADVRVTGRAEPAPARAMDRRAFFRLARERTTTFVAERLAEDGAAVASVSLPHRPALLDAVRARLAMTHPTADPAGPVMLPVAAAWYVDWDVSDACDGCAAETRTHCVVACPNGAWRVARSQAGAALTHDAASCSGCGACERACPRSALSARPAALAADAGRRSKRTLAAGVCRSCRQAPARGPDGLCRHCRTRLALADRVRPNA